MQKPSILIISHRLPYPLNSGGKQAIFNSINAIKEDYKVYLTYSEDIKKPAEKDVRAFLEVVKDKVSLLPYSSQHQVRKSNTLQRVANKLSRHFRNSHSSSSNPFSQWLRDFDPQPSGYIQHVNQIIREHNISIVQCEMLSNISFVNSLPTSVKKIFVHHELGFVRHELELKGTKDSALGRENAQKAKRLEIELLNKYDRIITLSSIDRKKLIEAGVTSDICDSFAIVDTSSPPPSVQCNPYELVFVGPDNHEPNYIGLSWFLESCWKQLLSKDSRYHLTIVGKWEEQNILDFSSRFPNLTFSGFVDNLAETLAGKVMIVPITVGSGIRMKILEAANLEIPFVSTSVGAEGIPVISGVHCFLADTPDNFMESILLLQDENLQRLFVQNAMQLIKAQFSMKALRENRVGILKNTRQ